MLFTKCFDFIYIEIYDKYMIKFRHFIFDIFKWYDLFCQRKKIFNTTTADIYF